MDDFALAKNVGLDNKSSRRQINQLVFPIISQKTACFCKKYCHGNHLSSICTLPQNSISTTRPASNDKPLCEWGNASYVWMLEDLTNKNRLVNYKGINGASLKTYLQSISNSIPFRERWRDWRFKNRVHVPVCIKEIHQLAPAIFLGLHNQKKPIEIAHQLKLNTQFIDKLADQIMIVLTKQHKLHLLLPTREISLTGFGFDASESSEGAEHQGHIPIRDTDLAQEEQTETIRIAWKKLSYIEQFVLEEMLINEEDAYEVLESLDAMNISIKKGVLPEKTNRQQLFYFKRKALKKLAILAGIGN